MDPVSHALFGRALAVTRRTRPRGLTAALVLGSLMPDLDAVWVFAGFDRYLEHHEAGTHTLVASPFEAILLAVCLRLIVRGSRVWPLFVASWIGIIGHIVWDLADSSDIRVFAPFSNHISGWHLVTMGEPAVLVLLAIIALVAWRWRDRRRLAIALLAAVGAFLLFKAGSQIAATHVYTSHVRPDPAVLASSHVTPMMNGWLDWRFDDRDGNDVRAWRISALGRAESIFEREDAAADALAQVSRELPVVRSFLERPGLPFARIERENGLTLVLWSDARQCSALRCDVSFGAAFDEHRTPLYQIVQIGTFRQIR